VVLVHGFLATRGLMWPLQRRLARTGRSVFTVPLSPLVIGDVRRLARELDQGGWMRSAVSSRRTWSTWSA
jgi:hypothetical protein